MTTIAGIILAGLVAFPVINWVALLKNFDRLEDSDFK
jgi:hypothetical protein